MIGNETKLTRSAPSPSAERIAHADIQQRARSSVVSRRPHWENDEIPMRGRRECIADQGAQKRSTENHEERRAHVVRVLRRRTECLLSVDLAGRGIVLAPVDG